MVQRQFRTWENLPAELAGIAIPQKNILPGQRAALLRNMPIGEQSDHRRNFMGMRGGVHFRVVQFFGLRYAFQQSAPWRAAQRLR